MAGVKFGRRDTKAQRSKLKAWSRAWGAGVKAVVVTYRRDDM